MLGRNIFGSSRMVDFRLIAILKMVVKLFKFPRKPELRQTEHGKY